MVSFQFEAKSSEIDADNVDVKNFNALQSSMTLAMKCTILIASPLYVSIFARQVLETHCVASSQEKDQDVSIGIKK